MVRAHPPNQRAAKKRKPSLAVPTELFGNVGTVETQRPFLSTPHLQSNSLHYKNINENEKHSTGVLPNLKTKKRVLHIVKTTTECDKTGSPRNGRGEPPGDVLMMTLRVD